MAHTWTLQVLLLVLVAGCCAQFQNQQAPGAFQPPRGGQPHHSRVVPDLPSAIRRKQQHQQGLQPQPQPQPFKPAARAPVPFQPPPPPPQPQPQPQQFFDQEQDFQMDYDEPAPSAPPAPLPRAPTRPAPPPNPLRRPALPTSGAKQTYDQELVQHQNENAKYTFSTAVTDGIMDNQLVREEMRDGLKLSGMYSYSDGFFKRTVHYEADEGGYRIINEEAEPIGNGPQEDPAGRAEVSSNVGGNNLHYSISGSDIARRPVPTVQPGVRGGFPAPAQGIAPRTPQRPQQQQQFPQQQFQQQQYQDDYQQ